MTALRVLVGDITSLEVDAIVNAANPAMTGGGGVDGAIHQAAGPELAELAKEIRERDYPNGLPTGFAVALPGFHLPAKWVIITVGPVFSEHPDGGSQLLADCYRNSLNEAKRIGARTIAFPAISTGVYGWPKERAAKVAVQAVRQWLSENSQTQLAEIIFVAFSADAGKFLEMAIAAKQ